MNFLDRRLPVIVDTAAFGGISMDLVKKIYAFKLSADVLRVIVILFMVAGLAGAMIQSSILGMNSLSNYQLFEKMQNHPDMMLYATASLIFQFLEACAIPIFALLLVERVVHMGSYGSCLIWLLGLATACQFPYNRITTGSLMTIDRLNPVFALVMSMIMLYFFCRFTEKRARNTALKVMAVVFVFLWSNILGIFHGAACVLITAVLWALRGKPNLQTFVGITVVLSCSILNIFYMFTPVSFLILHFYDGEWNRDSSLVSYLVYPVFMIIFCMFVK